MLEARPPRRDPRLLAIDLHAASTRFVAVDAWEVTALGALPDGPRIARLSLWRLFVQTKPSHVLVLQDGRRRCGVLLARIRERALREGLPLAVLNQAEARALASHAPDLAGLAETYPELRHLLRHPRSALVLLLRAALGSLTTRTLPPRRYVPTLPPRSHSPLAP